MLSDAEFEALLQLLVFAEDWYVVAKDALYEPGDRRRKSFEDRAGQMLRAARNLAEERSGDGR